MIRLVRQTELLYAECYAVLLIRFSKSSNKFKFCIARCTSEMETGRVDRPVGLPVGSRFFDRPVKQVEKPVEFSFLATKRHLSSNRNVLIYFIRNKIFYKKSVLTNHTFRKHLLNGFKL